ncbi:MAG TPA: hypothetical protein VH678_03535 [Xanthobacteraceae bacterium]|jgi:hypothetical protein
MFRWPNTAETNDTDDQWVVSTFRKRRAIIENASPAEQLAFQLTLAIVWKGFIAQHGSRDRFAQLPRATQMQYLKELLRLQVTLLDQKDFEKAIPLEMLNIYLAAIISKCRDFTIEAETFLDHHTSQGHRMAALVNAAMGTDKKASATAASW